MKIQFTLQDVLLAIVFCAVAFGAIRFVTQANREFSLEHLFALSLILSPLWLIVAFVGYALGRRRLTVPQLIVFVLAESVGIAWVWLVEMRGV